MIQALTDAAWYVDPEALWRAGCAWSAQGHNEHGEWLQEIAGDILDVRALSEVAHPFEVNQPTKGEIIGGFRFVDTDADIPF